MRQKIPTPHGEPLCVPSSGPLAHPGIRRILALAGYDLRSGPHQPGDAVAVWEDGASFPPDAPVVRIRPALLCAKVAEEELPAGLIIDPIGSPASAGPGRIERILHHDLLDDAALIKRSHNAMARLKRHEFSIMNISGKDAQIPHPGYILILDQPPGDPAIRQSGASAATFRDMLNAAVDDFPHARIVVRLHPAAKGRHHFLDMDFGARVSFLDGPVSGAELLESASAVYAVSSDMGFDAILTGHRPKIFGQPFYAGWGLTDDSAPIPHRDRKLSRAQMFAAAMILAPTWYDPCRDRLCTLEEAMDLMEARLRIWREDRLGHVAIGMDQRQHKALQAFFGHHVPLRFAATPEDAGRLARETGRGILVWGGADFGMGAKLRHVGNGFLSPKNRRAAPVSMVADDLGIYDDPSRESRLERLIAAPCSPDAEARAELLIRQLVAKGLTLAASGRPPGALPSGHRILVAGQPDNDGSVSAMQGNLDLLAACRAANPDAVLIYHPHPENDAGRAARPDTMPAMEHADHITRGADPVALIAQVDEVWTLASPLGFDALLRGKPVTCLGQPFYAGWGLTHDKAPATPRRTARPTLAQLVHAALIAYPRYRDPVSGLPCQVEVIVERLGGEESHQPGRVERILSALQPRRFLR